MWIYDTYEDVKHSRRVPDLVNSQQILFGSTFLRWIGEPCLEILVPARRLISPVVLPSRRPCDSSWKFLGTWGWSSIQRPEVLTIDKKRDGSSPKMQAFTFLVFGNAMLNKRNFHVWYVLSFGVHMEWNSLILGRKKLVSLSHIHLHCKGWKKMEAFLPSISHRLMHWCSDYHVSLWVLTGQNLIVIVSLRVSAEEHSNDRFQSLLTISRTPLIKEAKTRKDGKKAMFNTADWAFSKLSHKLPCQVALKRKLRIQNPPIKLLHGNRVSMILLQIAMKVKQKMSQLWAFDFVLMSFAHLYCNRGQWWDGTLWEAGMVV